MSTPAIQTTDRVDQWLEFQLSLHEREMALGLERVAAVARNMGVLPLPCRSVVVAGTNGKGSCAALIESLAGADNRVGVYSSPHLWRYNERIRMDGQTIDDASLCRAFEAVETARGETALTFFEYGTLAALWSFVQAGVDIAILEVGLGGRLDAVNIVDADVALITNIGLDHTEWLGEDRESIGREKAGIMRNGQPVICSDRQMPESIDANARRVGAQLLAIGRAFEIEDGCNGSQWHWRGPETARVVPRMPGVVAENLAASLMVAETLGLTPDRIDLARARLPGRREYVDGPVPVIYDVAHNREAITMLVEELTRAPAPGRTHIVIGMLADKPVAAVGHLLTRIPRPVFYPAGLETVTPRGLSGETLSRQLAVEGRGFASPRSAFAAASAAAGPGDRIVVCGSFFTVAGV